jgi:hypothetical protein
MKRIIPSTLIFLLTISCHTKDTREFDPFGYDSTIVGTWKRTDNLTVEFTSTYEIIKGFPNYLMNDTLPYVLNKDTLIIFDAKSKDTSKAIAYFNKTSLELEHFGVISGNGIESYIRYDAGAEKREKELKQRESVQAAIENEKISSNVKYYKWPCLRCGKQIPIDHIVIVDPSQQHNIYTPENGYVFCSQECFEAWVALQ